MGSQKLEQLKLEYSDRAPHDPRTDVKLAGDWLDRWLMELGEAELRAYLQLAHFYNTRTYHDHKGLRRILGGSEPEKVVQQLEQRGLVEVIRNAGQYHYHFPYRDSDGYHRGSRARPSLEQALLFQQRMSEELLALTEQDETPALRQKMFKRYPELEQEFRLYQATADDSAPRWRLWMELANLLIRQFEETYGSLRSDHGELFKEVSAKVLSHHLELVDGVVGQVVERLADLFPEVQDEWVIAPSEEEFIALPFVRRQAQRYGVGPEQIFLNVIEALGQQGRAVVSVDERGFLNHLILPSDTGLTKSEERVLFLRPEERRQADTPRNRERVRRARNKYANYLIERAVGVLADFVAVHRVPMVDAWLERVVELVNDSLDLLPMGNPEPLVKLEHVIDRYDALRMGRRGYSFVRHDPLPDEATEAGLGITAASPRPAKAAPSRKGNGKQAKNNTAKPSKGNGKPSKGNGKPSKGNAKQAKGNAKQAKGDAKPAKSGSKPRAAASKKRATKRR